MKLTKKQETEIWQVYNTWLHAYLNGDVATYDKYLDKDYHFIGSTDNEEFLSKKDTTKFFEKTADQLAGKCDLRNETRIIEKFGELVFITHLFDAWFINGDDWAYYGRFRFTNALQKNKEGWRFIYQHFSTTDSKTDEGETIGFDKVNAENLELKEAIKRRTFELEEKNRELEVEGALDRIRAQAVAMKETSDLLDIVVTMRNEFIKLGHEAHYFWHMMWLPDTYEKAMTSGDGSKIGFVMKLPRHIHGDIPLLAKWEKSKKQTVVYAMNVEEALGYVDKMVTLGDFQNIDPQAPTEDDVRHIGGLTFIMARTTHGEIGYSLPGIVKNPPKEDIAILVKFAGAFDLAHRRFLDLQKAENQARETQIELALEKVRSRSLAMHKSEELNEVVSVVFEKLKDLQIPATAVGIGIYIDGSKDLNSYVCGENKEGLVITNYRLPYFNNKISREICNMQEKQLDFFVGHYSKQVKNSFYKYILEHTPEFKHLPEDIKSMIFNSPSYTITMVRVNHAIFNINDFVGKTLSDDDIAIIKRFARVFDQSYTRFLDLQKAEAQARESEIELALERVRARTMAMQHSDELQEASFLLDQQVRALGIKTWGCAFNIYGEKESTEWFGNEAGVLPTYTVPRKGIFKKYYQKGQKGESFFIQEFSGKACVDHYEYMSSLPVIGDVLKNLKKTNKGFPTYQIDHVAYFKYGYLLFITKEHVPEAHDIFKRFAKVFQQTYTRFLDLQKAEKQARETQIELALERVRARTMSMQQSDELRDTALLLFQQVEELGINSFACGFNIWDEDKKFATAWMAGKDRLQPPFRTNSAEDVYTLFHKAEKRGESLFVLEQKGKELEEHYKYLVSIPEVKALAKAGLSFPTFQIIHCAYFSKGYLMFITHEPVPDAHDIFKRFATVFEQTYTRFLDLQKAEAQARESEIELALERVRARTMAMQHSDELAETSFVLFEQFKALGEISKQLSIGIFKEEKNAMELYSTLYGKQWKYVAILDLDEPMVMKKIHKAWKQKKKSLLLDLEGNDLKKYNKYRNNLSKQRYKEKRWVIHVVFFSKGVLTFSATEPHSNKTIELIERFAKVFEQTYTRFLDLQKAEAQAREAQIEAALERVRSRSMAMHNSEELKDVIKIVYQQLAQLKVNLNHAGFVVDYTPKGDWNFWIADEQDIPSKITHAYFESVWGNQFNKAKEKGENFFATNLNFEEKNTFYNKLLSFIPELPKASKDFYLNAPSLTASTVLLDNIGLYIENFEGIRYTDEENNILIRFGKVFQQTYTRFLDLQKAEAQAREAQIETALEKVRSRTMAMQKGEELQDVVVLLYKELIALGVTNFTTCGYVEINEKTKRQLTWVTSPGGDSLGLFYLPLTGDVHFDARYDAWKNQQTVFHQTVAGKERRKHLEYAITTFNSKEAEEMVLNQFPDPTVFYCFNFSHGYLHLVAGSQLTQDEETLLARFTRVFEQTYARFLDLKKAEAQARESEIELALERVRSRSMAMQKSSELLEAAELLWTEITKLGIENITSGFVLMEADEKIGWNYMPNPSTGKIVPEAIGVYHDKTDIMRSITKNWKKQKPLFVVELNEEQTIKHQTFIAEKSINFHITAEQLINVSPPELKLHNFNFNHGYLLIIGGTRLTSEQEEIMLRFTKVFQQTYTRFLDLQKAEAQTREAKIEMALEKVRSRTMAMQHSKELPEAANVLFTEVQNLGIPAWSCGYNILSEDKKSSTCIMSSEGEIQSPFVLPLTKHKSLKPWHKAILKNEDFFAYEQGGNALVEHYAYMESLPELKETFQQFKDADIPLPTFQVNHLARFTNGFLLFITYERVPEAHDIFQRFAKVFEQTYTRFLDLEKAEAQTRKAQIEASLERVRARAMAMHDSNELDEVLSVLCEQFDVLGILPMSTHMTVLDVENNTFTFRETGKFGNRSFGEQTVALDAMDNWKENVDNWRSNEATAINKLYFPKEQLPKVWEVFHESFASMPEGSRITPKDYPDGIYHTSGKHPFGYIGMNQVRPATEEEEQIIIKFANEFGRAFQRFLDLQKAEAQTREAQINLAVERVRAKALAMHKSEEIMEVVAKLKDEVMSLDIPNVIAATIFLKEGEDKVRMWDLSTLDLTDNNDYEVPFDITFKIKKTDPHLYVKRVWENTDDYFVEIQDEKGLKRIVSWLREHDKSEVADEVEEYTESAQLKQLYHAAKKLNNGKLVIDLLDPPSDEMETILTKMGAAFDLAYKRFEDLQKAEAQAKEAQIEAALEKVRSRSLAMHKPDELQEVVAVVAEKLKDLGVIFDAGGVILCTYFPDNKDVVHWIAVDDFSTSGRYLVPYFDNPIFSDAWDSKIRGDAYYSKEFTVEAKNHFFEQAFEHSDYKHMPKDYKEFVLQADKHHLSAAWSKNSAIIIPSLTGAIPSESDAEIMKRFAKVFEQAYIRFMDLQKAEAQAREAQIEVALERVRARAMAMHQTDELTDVLCVLFDQFDFLGINPVLTHLTLMDEENETFSLRITTTAENRIVAEQFIDINAVDAWKDSFANWKKSEPNAIDCIDYPPEALPMVWEVLGEVMDALPKGHKIYPKDFPEGLYTTQGHFKFGYIGFNHKRRATDEEKSIVVRFAKEFGRTYQRFLDLQKAEAQAKEAQIEGALEKVRSRSLAMHQSEELWDVISEIFLQLEVLKISIDSCFINIYKDEYPKDITCYIAAGGQTYKYCSFLAYIDIKIFNRLIEARKNEESFYSIMMDKEEKELWWNHFFAKATNIKVPITRKNYIAKTTGLVQSVVLGEYASIHMMKYVTTPYLEEENKILMRFGKAFDQVYTRFLDLEKAEAQAREAQIEAALERVRSRTMAMQKSEELAETSVVVFKQLLELGISPNRLFIGIIKENGEQLEAWATNEDGSKIETQFTLHNSKNKSIKKMMDGWKQHKKSLVIDMKGKELQDYFQYLNEDMDIPFIHGLKQKRRIQSIAYFSGGLIGMAAPEEQPEETIKLLERFAAVFNLTYTRFNDLKVSEAQTKKAEEDLIKLQAAKKSAEDALSELQTTQTQLIQSEKMASLGELTAGIAHEIQNPLNFVNNFSEVSKELLEEMLEEIENGDMEEVRAIMDDVIQNLEKINHHGKRADGIVKGMLQHSRKSSGTKEPTNINTLADEYLRLAYHGLRAKDKSFNATLVTDFDDTIGNINVLPQDIGRVVLNLLTNAFYVVNERLQGNQNDYKPTVTLTTKKNGNKVSISVKDNGNGIPKHVLEKIFQPFFTTKPTGQGTGLGLSMSYDIVTKGHGGELKVETEQGKGTEFIIVLPNA